MTSQRKLLIFTNCKWNLYYSYLFNKYYKYYKLYNILSINVLYNAELFWKLQHKIWVNKLNSCCWKYNVQDGTKVNWWSDQNAYWPVEPCYSPKEDIHFKSWEYGYLGHRRRQWTTLTYNYWDWEFGNKHLKKKDKTKNGWNENTIYTL